MPAAQAIGLQDVYAERQGCLPEADLIKDADPELWTLDSREPCSLRRCASRAQRGAAGRGGHPGSSRGRGKRPAGGAAPLAVRASARPAAEQPPQPTHGLQGEAQPCTLNWSPLRHPWLCVGAGSAAAQHSQIGFWPAWQGSHCQRQSQGCVTRQGSGSGFTTLTTPALQPQLFRRPWQYVQARSMLRHSTPALKPHSPESVTSQLPRLCRMWSCATRHSPWQLPADLQLPAPYARHPSTQGCAKSTTHPKP